MANKLLKTNKHLAGLRGLNAEDKKADALRWIHSCSTNADPRNIKDLVAKLKDNADGFLRTATASHLKHMYNYEASREDEEREADYQAAVCEAERRGWNVIKGERV